MNAEKFGAFIARCRKEQKMTQADLALKLQVTDKAVSRWERGLGFPDINTIQPLADALGVNVLEIMKSEKINETKVSHEVATELVTDTLDMAKIQRVQERKIMIRVLAITVVVVIFALFLNDIKFLNDVLVVEGLGVIFPIICIITAIVLCAYGIIRKMDRKPCGQTFALALFMLFIPFIVLGICFLLGVMGFIAT